MKKVLVSTLALAMLLGATTVANAAEKYTEASNHVTYSEEATPNTGHGGGVEKGSLDKGDTIGTGSVDVKISTGSESTTTNVYAVSIDTTELSFSYGSATSYIWNPEKQQYVIVTGSGTSTEWRPTAETITITNYSDLPIDVEATFQKVEDIADNFTVSFTDTDENTKSDSKLSLAAAVTTDSLKETGIPKVGAFTVALSGTPSVPYANTKLGTITLTIKVPGGPGT